MEFLKIVAIAVVAAVLYGLVHDQITIRICLEYFTVFHPHIFNTTSPTLLALGWGVIATWWAGLIMGTLLAISARVGIKPQLSAAELLRPIAILLGVMAVSATASGLVGFYLAGSRGWQFPEAQITRASDFMPRLFAAWWAHSASYASGFLGSLVICVLTLIRRRQRSRNSEAQLSGLPISQ